MSPYLVIAAIVCYFLILILIGKLSSKGDSNAAFFLGNRNSPWFVVAFGMIGASLSGVTFISVPGWVDASQFSYMQTVLGYLVGYLVIAFILLPLYYRLGLTTIYGYLKQRYGQKAYLTGSSFFLLSRVIGASFRLYLVAMVLQFTVFDAMGWQVPFAVTVGITILLIWLYTHQGGIKTIIWTDTLQTATMLLAVVMTILGISSALEWNLADAFNAVQQSQYSQIFFFEDVNDSRYFWKQFVAGAFIAIAMTGLDQDMMQKNLTCRNTKEAQWNILSMSGSLVFVNLLFLSLGALLYIFVAEKGIALPEKADQLYPALAMQGYFGTSVALFFIIGLIAAAYSSADSALTSLTTTFSVDFLEVENKDEQEQLRLRKRVHIAFSVLLFLVIVVFEKLNNDSVISELFTMAGYTYGPLLGLFFMGLFTKFRVKDKLVPLVCIIAPLLTWLVKENSAAWFGGYQMSFELLLVNGCFTALGLLFIRSKS